MRVFKTTEASVARSLRCQVPGMMTGQILGGTAPDLAARYQIVIIFSAWFSPQQIPFFFLAFSPHRSRLTPRTPFFPQ